MKKISVFPKVSLLTVSMLLCVACADRRLPGLSDDDQDDAANLTTNIVALHDSSSSQYRDDCLSCHSEILTEETLDPSVPTAHNAMLPETPGDTTQAKCVYCHTSTDLLQHSAGNIRRQVAVQTCDLCHGPGGAADEFQYYQE